MSRIIIIAAVSRNLAIGIGGDMPFHISADLRRFKSLTMGSPLIMGRRTFESFPGGALPGRRNIVITRNPAYTAADIETAPGLDRALEMAAGAEKVFVIGGGQIYHQALQIADELDITEIDSEVVDADTFFPDYRTDRWRQTARSETMTDPRSGIGFRFCRYKRR